MPTIAEIASDIYLRARQQGVNPNLALGIAAREGLIPRVINSPTFGNPDVHGYSYGPWQLYSGSPTPGSTAPGGQAALFRQRFGAVPSAANWPQQNQFAIELLARLNPQQQAATWHAIGDAGGHQAIMNIGQRMAQQLGIQNIQGNPVAFNNAAGGAPVAGGGGDGSFELGPPPSDELPQPDNSMAQAEPAQGTGMGMSDMGGGMADYAGGDMGSPLDDAVSSKYAQTRAYRKMGVKQSPTDMQLADVFQPQNVTLEKIGAARQLQQAPRKMSVG